jgi:hypothetical protein
MARAKYTARSILRQLDECAAAYTFPCLDNGYIYPADVRLTGYRDDARWALVIEHIGYGYKLSVPDGLENTLYRFGNCVEKPGFGGRVQLIANDPDLPAFPAEAYGEEVSADARVILIRGQAVPIPWQAALFTSSGARRRPHGLLFPQDLLRALLGEHRLRLLATEEELRREVPSDLPQIIRLDEWHHPDVAGGHERPSSTAAFRMIAEVLATGDPSRYRPTEPPNTHWSNWPRGGTL